MLSIITLFTVIAVASILYWAGLTLYRLYFHPLADYPGPKLAAATFWYECYFDLLQHGQYVFEIQRLHEIYGPIIRVTPDELHCNDPVFIDTLYTGGSVRRDKYDLSIGQYGYA